MDELAHATLRSYPVLKRLILYSDFKILKILMEIPEVHQMILRLNRQFRTKFPLIISTIAEIMELDHLSLTEVISYLKGYSLTGIKLTDERIRNGGNNIKIISDVNTVIQVVKESYYITMYWLHNNNQIHREHGPAMILKYKDSPNVFDKYWYINNKLHRTDGPAAIYYKPAYSEKVEKWFYQGRCHRDNDKPAITAWRLNESKQIQYKSLEVWSQYGVNHRMDNPAVRSWNKNKIMSETWYYYGVPIDGPSEIANFSADCAV